MHIVTRIVRFVYLLQGAAEIATISKEKEGLRQNESSFDHTLGLAGVHAGTQLPCARLSCVTVVNFSRRSESCKTYDVTIIFLFFHFRIAPLWLLKYCDVYPSRVPSSVCQHLNLYPGYIVEKIAKACNILRVANKNYKFNKYLLFLLTHT